jgi:electron transfer flavoprotein alpha subunit
MADNKGILVVGEIAEGKLLPITSELLGAGRRLADELKEPVFCCLIGDKIGDMAKSAIAAGADTVCVADDAQLKDYQTDSFMQIM